jgi:hypothetical protein
VPPLRSIATRGIIYTVTHAEFEALAAVERWFAERQFDLSFEACDGFTWANLTRRESGYVLHRYGRGYDRLSAAERARQRWQQEQGG